MKTLDLPGCSAQLATGNPGNLMVRLILDLERLHEWLEQGLRFRFRFRFRSEF